MADMRRTSLRESAQSEELSRNAGSHARSFSDAVADNNSSTSGERCGSSFTSASDDVVDCIPPPPGLSASLDGSLNCDPDLSEQAKRAIAETIAKAPRSCARREILVALKLTEYNVDRALILLEHPQDLSSSHGSGSPRRDAVNVQSIRGTSLLAGGTRNKKTSKKKLRRIASQQERFPQQVIEDKRSQLDVTVSPGPSPGDIHYVVRVEYCLTDASVRWSRPDKAGELLKPTGRGLGGIKYKPRWYVLQGQSLFCFREKPIVGDEPSMSLNLIGAALTTDVESGKRSDRRSSSANVVGDAREGFEGTGLIRFSVTQHTPKKEVLVFGTRQRVDAESWMAALGRAISKEEAGDDLEVRVFEELHVDFSPSTGFVGLPSLWKLALSQAQITERQFYEEPRWALKQLRKPVSTMTESVVPRAPSSSDQTSLSDVVNTRERPARIFAEMKLCGEGSFGEVYEAIDTRNGQTVAIKKMLVTPKRAPNFAREIHVQRETQHPNVVSLFDAFLPDDHLWVVMEFMDGGNLTNVIKDAFAAHIEFAEPSIAYIFMETLKAMSYLHANLKLHRDIKSDNILIGRKGEVKLADFGYAVQLQSDGEKRSTICGTPYWMSPEIIRGEEYDKGVDIWALGIMLMECCDGDPPFINEPPTRAMTLISTQQLPALKSDAWSKELVSFLKLCTNELPSKRPAAIELMSHPWLHCMQTSSEFLIFLQFLAKKTGGKQKGCLIQ